MFKAKILHKCLILVATPLVLGTIFVCLLTYGVSDFDKNWMQTILFAGLFMSILVTVSLAVFFSRSISNRILIIVENTLSLTQGNPLNPPLKGSDEIAELDQFLYKAASEIKDLESFKRQMISVVSHELKSPLSSVEMFLSSMHAGVYGALDQSALCKVERTHSRVVRLMTVVKDLLYLDKLELEMNPEEFKAADMIRTCLDITRELATEAGVNIVINTYPQLIYGDRNRLIQVLVNLLTNSIKFSPRGGTIRIETATTRGCFELRVSDQGRGIPESVRKQIFEPFKQVNADDAKRGAGLGLTIARTIIHQHGGEIAVESSEGKGSTFFFRIPLSCQNAIYHRRPAQPRFPGLIANEKYLPMFKGNFSVLQQSFTILALPLIFQSVFVSIVGCLLYKIPGQMMTTMEAILATGLVFNVAMSVYLALFLTRRFTKRLQHIMENTRRLVRREELLMPLGGHDEISFLDETLYETARHLVELESFKRDLVLVVRNELKTPLMAILVSLEMFEKGSLGQISMKARGRLAIAKGEANRLIRLTSDLLNIETIQAGKIVLNKSAVNISEIVNWSIQSVATLAERKSINISAKVPNVVSVVDSDRICQVLINLLSNAIKYSPDGSDIQVEVSWHDDQVEFRIVDHGRGIPADLNVFEPYVQVSEEDSTVLSGTGLGLTIARSIIEEHGGHIGVNSQPGVGSTFWFQLPTCA